MNNVISNEKYCFVYCGDRCDCQLSKLHRPYYNPPTFEECNSFINGSGVVRKDNVVEENYIKDE